MAGKTQDEGTAARAPAHSPSDPALSLPAQSLAANPAANADVAANAERRAVGPASPPAPHVDVSPSAPVLLRASILEAEQRHVEGSESAAHLGAERPSPAPSDPAAHLAGVARAGSGSGRRSLSPARGMTLEPAAREGGGAAPLRRMTPPLGMAVSRDPLQVAPLVPLTSDSAPPAEVGDGFDAAHAAPPSSVPPGSLGPIASIANLEAVQNAMAQQTVSIAEVQSAAELPLSPAAPRVVSVAPMSRALDVGRPRDSWFVKAVVVVIVSAIGAVIFTVFRALFVHH